MSAATIELVRTSLAQHEAVIERGLESFLEVGNALQAIRSERLYLATHKTFGEYCMERWGFSDSRARQLTLAANAVTNVTVGGLPAPANEGQARELARVPEPHRAEVWRETLERTGGQPTAAAVRGAAAEHEREPAPVSQPSPELTPRRAQSADKRRRQTLRSARAAAADIVSALRVDAVAIVAGVELGETDLITPEMVAELRAVVEMLADQLASGGAE